MYKEILEKHNVEQTPEFTLSVLTSEVGKLHQMYYRRLRFGKEGYLGDEKITLGDTISMAGLLAEQRGCDLEQLKEEGLQRFDERIKEVKEDEIKRRYGDSPGGN